VACAPPEPALGKIADEEPELLPPELWLPDPDPVLEDPEPDLAAEPVPPAPDPAEPWVEPGRVAAIAPVASTPATPTPAVTADSRFRPRRLSADGGTRGSPGSLGIGDSFPSG
jgi:hypothetical protein